MASRCIIPMPLQRYWNNVSVRHRPRRFAAWAARKLQRCLSWCHCKQQVYWIQNVYIAHLSLEKQEVVVSLQMLFTMRDLGFQWEVFAFTIDLLSLPLENQKAWLAGYGVTRHAIGVWTDAGRVRDLVIILMTQQQRDLRCLQTNTLPLAVSVT